MRRQIACLATETMMTETLEQLRHYWQAAPTEERMDINITAAALKVDDELTRDIVTKRIEAHKRRYETQNYDI